MAEPGNKTNIQAAMDRLVARVHNDVCLKYAAQAEQLAKENAPWENRTGDARKLLKGVAFNNAEVTVDTYKQNEKGKTVKSGSVTIDRENQLGFALFHRVEYGKYLETANSNKYAVLKPTIESLRADFFKQAKAFFGDKS